MLGVCSHVFIVIDPAVLTEEMDATAAAAAAALGASAKDGSETGAKIKFTYEQAIREVVLRKAESEVERGMRLARLVMTRWRAPVSGVGIGCVGFVVVSVDF